MATRSRSNLQSQINTLVEDNSSESVTPADLRSVLTDINDSAFNKTDDLLSQYSVSVDISSSEILNMFTTPKTIVAARGANKGIVPLSIIIKLKFITAAYGSNTILDFKIGSQVVASLSGFLNGSASQYVIVNLLNLSSSVAYSDTTTVKRSDGSTPTDGNITTSGGVMQTTVSQGTRVENISSITVTGANTIITTFNTDLVLQVRTGNPTSGSGTLKVFSTFQEIDMS